MGLIFIFTLVSRKIRGDIKLWNTLYVAPQSSSRAQQDIILFLMIMVNMQSMKVLHYTVIGRKSRNIMAKLRLFYKVYVCAMQIVHIDIILKYRQRQRLLIILKKLWWNQKKVLRTLKLSQFDHLQILERDEEITTFSKNNIW